MKTHRWTVLPMLLCCLAVAALAPDAHAAGSLGIAKWEAGTCTGNETQVKACKYSSPHSAFYTQAAGHPEWGLTGFELSNSGAAPSGSALKRLRVDIPPGLAADPQALAVCSRAQFESNSCPASTKAGFVELKAYVEIPVLPVTLTLKGNVYNLPQEAGHPLLFGIDVEGVKPLVNDVHLLLEGQVSFAHEEPLAARGVPSGDFHEWFEINNIPEEVEVEPLGLPLISAKLRTVESKLFFDGHAGKEGKEDFLTLPSDCGAPPTSYLELETYPPVEKLSAPTTPPVGIEGCDKVPFEPTATVTPETSQYDSPDGPTTDVRVPQLEKSEQINTADIDDAHVTLPEGLTLNPSAASGLQACTRAELHKGEMSGKREPVPNECPAASKIGTVNIETDLPPGSLAGNVYLGNAGSGPITDPPFLVLIDAESVYGVSVRLEGKAEPNPSTGRLEVSFLGNPQLPFSDLTLTTTGGPRAPLANPLTCAAASTSFAFSAYTGASFGGTTPFTTSGCPSSIPFSLSQGTADSSSKAGAYTHYTFTLTRADGQQYVSKVSTVLPAGLAGMIPSVALCGEPQAGEGSCPTASQIGTANVSAGSGEPSSFSGPVYLTGPYSGAPYGLSIPVEAKAGPFDLGRLTTRATINVDPHSARVIVAATLPTIFKGVPLRLRNISVAVDHENFMFNPTNCGALSTDTALTSTFSATQSLSSPFSVTGCSTLPFKPAFSAATSASTNPAVLKANGAALRVNLLQGAHEANIHSVLAELPKSLPSRLTTLQKACAEATYAANPYSCPSGSKVGSATVTTPVLPEPLKGPAYLVSHGGAAFPDLDLLLEGDHGIRVILEGNTNIKGGITTSTFASIPDVPVSSFVLELPSGPNSALTATGALCTQTLAMPTTITAQSGAVIKQATPIAVAGCTGGKGRTRIKILSKRIVRHGLVLRVQTFAPGRVSVENRDLRTTFRKFAKAGKFTIKAPLSRTGLAAQGAHRLRFKFRVGFLPKSKAESISVAYASIGATKNTRSKRKH